MPRYADNDILNLALWWTRSGSHTQYTAITSATTLTPPSGANKVMMQNTSTVNVRYRLDGEDPTTSVGFLLQQSDGPRVVPVNVGDTLIVIGEDGAVLDLMWGTVG